MCVRVRMCMYVYVYVSFLASFLVCLLMRWFVGLYVRT